MAELDIELDRGLVRGVERLAVHYYGNSGDASIGRVVEAALEMRLLWMNLAEGSRNEIEEPTTSWQLGDGQPAQQVGTEIREWLFKRR
jgi:hypothetical protein